MYRRHRCLGPDFVGSETCAGRLTTSRQKMAGARKTHLKPRSLEGNDKLPAPAGVEAIAAIDGTAAARFERHFGRAATGQADGRVHPHSAARPPLRIGAGAPTVVPVAVVPERVAVRALRRPDGIRVPLRPPFGPAVGTAHRLLESALGVKKLFWNSEVKRSLAIGAGDVLIGERNLGCWHARFGLERLAIDSVRIRY